MIPKSVLMCICDCAKIAQSLSRLTIQLNFSPEVIWRINWADPNFSQDQRCWVWSKGFILVGTLSLVLFLSIIISLLSSEGDSLFFFQYLAKRWHIRITYRYVQLIELITVDWQVFRNVSKRLSWENAMNEINEVLSNLKY